MVKVNSVCGLVALYMMFGFVRLWLVNIKRQLWLKGYTYIYRNKEIIILTGKTMQVANMFILG